VFLPWEPRFATSGDGQALREVAPDAREPEDIGRELRGLMDRLPWDDGGAARAEFEGFYLPLRRELVLGNEDVHPARRRFTALSPWWPEPAQAGREAGDADGPDGPDEPEAGA
jgi:hypothetical protein